MGYLSNFIVYMLAMLGVMALALFIFKQTTCAKIRKSSGAGTLKVIDTLSLGARKTLYVVEVGKEKFLIAGDAERTNLISKLDSFVSAETCTENLSKFQAKRDLGIHTTQKVPYETVIKRVAEKISR